MTGTYPEDIETVVQRALEEDVGSGDLTALLIAEDRQARAQIITREEAVLCGVAWVEQVCRQVDDRIHIDWHVDEGRLLVADQLICTLQGPARGLLTAERTALNFLQTLSGTATLARRYADAVAGLPVKVLDTRKTLPGLRQAQKYAVVCGGCFNHRHGLYDGILIKENHIMAAGSIAEAVRHARRIGADLPVEVEIERLEQMDEALEAGADILLLDNFDLQLLREAVQRNAGRAQLEASGGVSLQTVRAIAETGVERISVGALTKDVRAVDLSMRFDYRPG